MSKTKALFPFTNSPRKALVVFGLSLVLVTLACVRSAPTSQGLDAADVTQQSAETADAQVQMTLQALLGSATVESLATATPTSLPTATPVLFTATPTIEEALLAQLAGTQTAMAGSPTAEPTEEGTPTETSTPKPTGAPCFAARYAFDETYPDGTRVDPGQAIQKTWRLQNVGTCDWVAGQYELVFVNGDRMNGTTPLTINITVLAGQYANFSINLRAPAEGGEYQGDWVLRTKAGQVIGLGPNADLPFWVNIIVRGN
jgi:hypothetical protein